MLKTKNLIVGGGFAGLYLASILDEATLIEGSQRLGGLLNGFETATGFTFDIGGHVYTTADEKLTKLMLDSGAKLVDNRLAFFDFKRRVPYPIQYYNDMLDIEVSAHPLDHYSSLSELLYHEFGDAFYERILKPFNSRVWSTSPDSMDADWVTGRVALLRDKQARWGTNASFYYAPGKSIINQLIDRITLNNTNLVMQSQVVAIDYKRHTAKLLSWGDAISIDIEYENLFDTSGITLMDMRLDHVLPHNQVTTIGIGLNTTIDDTFHWWYNGVDNKSPIHRATLLSRYHETLAPAGVDSLLVEIPHPAADKTWEIMSTETGSLCADAAICLLEAANFPHKLSRSDVAEVTIIKSKGYPIPLRGHRKVIAHARGSMLKDNVYLVGRWGAHGYYNLDHIIKDAEAAVMASMPSEYDDYGYRSIIRDYLWANYYYKERK